MDNSLKEARKLFDEKKYEEACTIFLKFQRLYEAGFCYLLLNNEKNARECWEKDKIDTFASNWGLCVLDLISLKMTKYPSYLQIRAFYEMYLTLLIENNFIDWAQNLINMYPTLSKINSEIYKFLARALYSEKYFELSLDFVKKVKEQNYTDPEALFISAEIHYMQNNYSASFDDIKEILDIIPEYYPALKLKEKLLRAIS